MWADVFGLVVQAGGRVAAFFTSGAYVRGFGAVRMMIRLAIESSYNLMC